MTAICTRHSALIDLVLTTSSPCYNVWTVLLGIHVPVSSRVGLQLCCRPLLSSASGALRWPLLCTPYPWSRESACVAEIAAAASDSGPLLGLSAHPCRFIVEGPCSSDMAHIASCIQAAPDGDRLSISSYIVRPLSPLPPAEHVRTLSKISTLTVRFLLVQYQVCRWTNSKLTILLSTGTRTTSNQTLGLADDGSTGD